MIWTVGAVHEALLHWGQRVAREKQGALGYPRAAAGFTGTVRRMAQSMMPGDMTTVEFDDLETAITALGPEHRRAIVLTYVPGSARRSDLPEDERNRPLTDERIAMLLQIPRTTYRYRMNRARALIAEALNATEVSGHLHT